MIVGLSDVVVGCVGGTLDSAGNAEASASGVQVCRVLVPTGIVGNWSGGKSRGAVTLVDPHVMGTVEAKVLVGGQRVRRFCLLFFLTLGSRRDETTTGLGSIEEFETGCNRNAASDD